MWMVFVHEPLKCLDLLVELVFVRAMEPLECKMWVPVLATLVSRYLSKADPEPHLLRATT